MSAILSRLRYAIEVTTAGNEASVKRLEGMQSKAARYVLGRRRKEWSRTEGYAELNWLTIPQTSVESSLRLFLKVLWNKKPREIFLSIFDEDKEEVVKIPDNEIENMRKLSRKSWRIRVLRYSKFLPESMFLMDPNSQSLKTFLKMWVKENIEKDGDYIFKGKLKPPVTDWLCLEQRNLRNQMEHEIERKKQLREIEEMM